ncbi:hypothetical protein [Micromonospora pisi]|uniref:hypothetical protein n=1 Tax=Micromonospora pisi TaxID=589240 RepID=UPI000EB39001|nr:hypothetical protein [Micromonospora pisi]
MLGDHVIHHLGIAFAVGRPGVLSSRVTHAVLAVATRVPNPFIPAPTRAHGLTIPGADTTWSRSSDRRLEVVGPGESIISVLAGQRHAIAGLTGDGVVTLASRL